MKYPLMCSLLLTACVGEREVGPHANEYGLVMYWEVLGSEGRADKCTDSADWSEVVSGPVLNTGSFLMYRVEEGGLTATGQSCENMSSNSCSDSDLTWQIDQNILSYQAEPQLLESTGECDIELLATWTVVDEGETALFQVEIQFRYQEGEPACEAIETALGSESPNGFGLADCTVTIDADMGFATVN